MPYINEGIREGLAVGKDMSGPGDLNYLLTRMIHRYIEHRGMSYQTINDIIGALECCKHEFYRRKVVPYENVKLSVNGDVS